MKHNTHSQPPAHERSPSTDLPLFPTTKTDVPRLELPIALQVAELELEQLMKSERGQTVLVALRDLLRNDGSWSLDAFNQDALTSLLQSALVNVSVRELIIDRVTVARIH